jgi:cell wall-associated NlpC family hydrolase
VFKTAVALTAGFLLLPVLMTAMATGSLSRGGVPANVPGIPDVLLDAYARAPGRLALLHLGCTGMTWAVLAGIGRVESHHAHGSTIKRNGDILPPIIGPRLDGSGAGGNTTPHFDTDDGELDHDTHYDRAVGPTQHLPATWAAYGTDANGDGRADPHNAYDAALSTAILLCLSDADHTVDFTDREQLRAALYRYNRSHAYVDEVIGHIDAYTTSGLAAASGKAGSRQGRTAVEWALKQVGKPYVWGGTGPGGFDCSGLVMRAWEEAGVTIPRVTTDQYRAGAPVALDDLQPGDLLFYDTSQYAPGPAPTHVTMYIGEGRMVNAPSTGKTIRTEPVASDFYGPLFMGAVRPT